MAGKKEARLDVLQLDDGAIPEWYDSEARPAMKKRRKTTPTPFRCVSRAGYAVVVTSNRSDVVVRRGVLW